MMTIHFGSLRKNLSPQTCLGKNRLVLAIGAFEVGDFMGAIEVPDPGRDFIDQILVMRDQQHRSGIALQRNIKGVD